MASSPFTFVSSDDFADPDTIPLAPHPSVPRNPESLPTSDVALVPQASTHGFNGIYYAPGNNIGPHPATVRAFFFSDRLPTSPKSTPFRTISLRRPHTTL
jgi:hypothetical protein